MNNMLKDLFNCNTFEDIRHLLMSLFCYYNCNSFGVTMDLLNSHNFKVAITQLSNVQQV